MKKLNISLLLFFLALLFVVTGSADSRYVFAHAGHTDSTNSETPSAVLDEVLNSRGLETVDQLSCEDVTDEEWETLGEAVMSTMHPDPDQHEAMDKIMGGEGSETLKNAHIDMGKTYVGCTEDGVGMMGMMMNRNGSSSMLDTDTATDLSGMMGGLYHMGYGTGSLGFAGALVFWSVISIIVFLVVRTFRPKDNKSALDILHERYAKGEIDKTEFDNRKKDLTL